MPRAKHKPYLSADARKALNEISEHNYRIHERLSDVSDEADLKAIADLARVKGRDDPFMLAIATATERRLDLFERHRTGRGAWFAVVQALKWDPFADSGEMEILAQAKCETRPGALSIARQMLAEHAAKISENVWVEGKVICELDDEAEGLRNRR